MSMFSKISHIFGDPNKRELKKLEPLIKQINELEPELKKLSKEELKEKTIQLKQVLKEGKTEDDILPSAFALVREAARRTLKQRHYDVQLIGGIILHQGKIAEMRTGEGKTLASTCPAFLNALSGRGVHLVTVNDYLARRDAVWMGQIYYLLGLSVGCLVEQQAFVYDPAYQPEEKEKTEEDERDEVRDELGSFKVFQSYLRPVSRQEAYRADITYGTNNQFGFDYLRDNLVYDLGKQVQRGHHYAIVDEIDSILIDEARTPLIISTPAEQAADIYYQLARMINNLRSGRDYLVDEENKTVSFSEVSKEGFSSQTKDLQGLDKLVEMLGKDPWKEGDQALIRYIYTALRAKALFKKDRDYVIKNGRVVIVDHFTGRLMPGRRFSEGIHQAIEAKEHVAGHPEVEVREESRTMATITFQNYFNFYQKLSGMTGTAVTEAEEFYKIYDLSTIIIPTNEPMIRQDLPDKIYRTEEAKLKAVVEEVKERQQQGQPVLIGTPSVEKNEQLAKLLVRHGIKAAVLNAKNHEREGEIIAQAGQRGAVTLATNMAGRGVDIILGGNPPDAREQQEVLKLGGLHVIGTERHEARRIDNQLRGRAGRQGDPGSSQFFVSLEDDLMRIFGGERLASLMRGLKLPADVPIEHPLVSRAIASAQKKVEERNFDIRKHLLEYDNVLNKHRETIYRKRKEVLTMNDQQLEKKVLEMIDQEIDKIVAAHTAGDKEVRWDIKGIVKQTERIFPLPQDLASSLQDIRHQAGDKREDAYARDRMIKYLNQLAREEYERLKKRILDQVKNTQLQEKDLLATIERHILLRSIDYYWINHLEDISHLKEHIGFRAYGQREPLVEYKRESFRQFGQFLDTVRQQVVYSIYKVGITERAPVASQEIQLQGPAKKSTGIKKMTQKKKVGRNDPCPCGSGKKYKKCCWPKYG